MERHRRSMHTPMDDRTDRQKNRSIYPENRSICLLNREDHLRTVYHMLGRAKRGLGSWEKVFEYYRKYSLLIGDVKLVDVVKKDIEMHADGVPYNPHLERRYL